MKLNPRENDNFGVMVCAHKRYCLGDAWATLPDGKGFADFSSLSEADKSMTRQNKGGVSIPLYMYDHSGLEIKTTPFHCTFDSGRIGWIYATNEKIKKEYNVKRIGKKVRALVQKRLAEEVIEYNDYLNS